MISQYQAAQNIAHQLAAEHREWLVDRSAWVIYDEASDVPMVEWSRLSHPWSWSSVLPLPLPPRVPSFRARLLESACPLT
jgi:hypothetical protein